MSLPTPLVFRGAPGSPYSRKMRALLRYRHIPYRFVVQGSAEDRGLPEPRVFLLPTFFLPDPETGEITAVTDSSPLLRRFDEAFAGRSVIAPDPVVDLVDRLLEDYGDEWLTKAMFHYRWAHRADVEKAAAVLPLWRRVDVPRERVEPLAKQFAERQIGRLGVVGSNDTTAGVIEESYRRFLRTLDAHLSRHPFLLGGRPGAGDFAVYGQLTQLALFDPTPAAVTLAESPRVVAWTELVEDLSGLEPRDDAWLPRDALADALGPLLAEMGRTYVPVMLANERALAAGAERVECEVDGRPWVQKPFPYQGKCVAWLRETYASLSPDDRAAAAAVLAGTGCEPLFEG